MSEGEEKAKKAKAFVVYAGGEHDSPHSYFHYCYGYLKSIYTFQGESFTSTSVNPEEARLFDTEKAAERWANSKELAFIIHKRVEEVEVSPDLIPSMHDCRTCEMCTGEVESIGTIGFLGWCRLKCGKGRRLDKPVNKCAHYVKKGQ